MNAQRNTDQTGWTLGVSCLGGKKYREGKNQHQLKVHVKRAVGHL